MKFIKIPKTIRKYEKKFDEKTKRFLFRHPVLGFFSVFVGMPLFVLACVCLITASIALPVAGLLGWL